MVNRQYPKCNLGYFGRKIVYKLLKVLNFPFLSQENNEGILSLQKWKQTLKTLSLLQRITTTKSFIILKHNIVQQFIVLATLTNRQLLTTPFVLWTRIKPLKGQQTFEFSLCIPDEILSVCLWYFLCSSKKVEADKWLSTNKDEEIKLIGQQSLLYSCTGRLLAVL